MTRLLCVIMYKNGREKMWQFILGSAGFLLYFIYDINSIKKKNTFFQKFFAWGTVLVVLSLVMELWLSWGQCQHRIGRIIGFGTGALCFLALLIYTFIYLVFCPSLWRNLLWRKQITCGIYRGCVRSVPSSRSFMVRRSISLHVGNVWRMETGNLFSAYDFLELSVYHFSGSVDFSTDIF